MSIHQSRRVFLKVYSASEAPFEYFSLILTLTDAERILRRMELFEKYRQFDHNLHEFIFQNSFEGGFHKTGSLQRTAHQPPDLVALEMIISTFSNDQLSHWKVTRRGRLQTRLEEDGRVLAVQWRGYDLQSGEPVYSAPLWRSKVQRIKDELTPSAC